ncbi:carboxylate-amine ligase [Nocardia aurantia]|uniref:Putative glutamate--cysteine ligase 2 n=1 Tax=Nocardia aurantia TaxID=2585199 RepID=A0A7K0DQP5_9NOCA|nr:glutamate--cysteine ligase [Nocardia aurantia]MQY28031.1 Glutamate--cysteine ligase [Nocardia aurantia]
MAGNARAVTVGVEEEFLLTDPVTGAPAPKNREVAEAAKAAGVEVDLELTSCQVETSTGVHTDIRELHTELQRLRTTVADCAAEQGARLLAVAVPPTMPQGFPVTDTPRYQQIAEHYGMIAHEQGLCGCHVHVGVPDREAAITVSNHVRPWLPVLLALTANSPIYQGRETGYASWRSILWRRWPSAGPPPYFASRADYESIVAMMRAGGSILDKQMVYWDVRASESFPTVEIRVSDIPATSAESAVLAALVRATVTTGLRAIESGRAATAVPGEVLRVAYWNAAHSGLDGPGLDPIGGAMVSHRELLTALIDHTETALRETGDLDFVTEYLDVLDRTGNGARRQLAALRAHDDIADVINEIAHATLQSP